MTLSPKKNVPMSCGMLLFSATLGVGTEGKLKWQHLILQPVPVALSCVLGIREDPGQEASKQQA